MPSDELHTSVALNDLPAVKNFFKKMSKKMAEKAVNSPATQNGVRLLSNEIVFYTGDPPLKIAVLNQNDSIVKVLLEHGADPNDKFGPLKIAVLNGNYSIAKMLLEKGANPNREYQITVDTKDRQIFFQNIPLLGVACLKNALSITELLLTHKADVNTVFLTQTHDQFTPLALASYVGSIEIIEILCRFEANVNQALKFKNSVALNVLCVAICSDFPLDEITRNNVVKCLVEKGANVNYISNEYSDESATIVTTQITPLMLATDKNYPLIVLTLIMKGADVYFMTDPNVQHSSGRSVLVAALELESSEDQLLKIVLQKIKKTEHPNKINVLSAALTYGCIHLSSVSRLKMLLEHIDPNQAPLKDSYYTGVLPLVAACEKGNADTVRLLLERGAEVNKVNPHGRWAGAYPLFIAVAGGHKEVVTLLHEKGANPGLKVTGEHLKDHNCFSLLSTLDNPELLEYLLQLYPEIQPAQIEGYPPLVCAISTNKVEAVKVLLKSTSPVAKLFVKNYTPLSLAIQLGRPKIVNIMAESGFNINDPFPLGPHAGRTPLFTAIFLRKISAVRELVKHKANPSIDCDNERFDGRNAWWVAFDLCDQSQQPDFLLELLMPELDEKALNTFSKLIREEKLTALFSAVLMENIALIDLILKTQGKMGSIYINEIMRSEKYAGESPLAAAAYGARADILRKFTHYDCNWNQVITSKRMNEGKSILQIIQDKMVNENLQFVVLQKNKNIKPVVLKKNVVPFSKKPAENTFDLADLVSQVANKHNKYYIYYAFEHLEAIKSILDISKINRGHLELNVLEYHLIRLFQALYLYGKKAQDNEILSADLCWSIRNILMHFYADLGEEKIYELGEYTNKFLMPVIQDSREEEGPITISFGLVGAYPKNNNLFKTGNEILSIFKGWLSSAGKNLKSSSHETTHYYTTIILNELEKIKNFLMPVEDPYLHVDHMTAIKMSLVYVGECYQQLKNRGLIADVVNKSLEFLENCKTVRDAVGHEFTDFRSFSDNLEPSVVWGIAMASLPATELFEVKNISSSSLC